MSLVKVSGIKYVSDDALRRAAFDLHGYIEREMTVDMIAKAMEDHLPLMADSPRITWWDMRNPEHQEEWYPKEHFPDGPPRFITSFRWIVEGKWLADTTRSFFKTIQLANAYGIGRYQRRPA